MRAVNLIPVDQRSGAAVGLGRSQGGAYALLAVIGVLALFGVLYGKASHDISSRRTQIAGLTAQASQASSDAVSLAAYETLNATRERRLKAVEELTDSRFDWARAMHEFGSVLPAHVTVTALSGTIAGSAAPAAPAAGSTSTASSVTSATPPGSVPSFSLTGCTRNQEEVAQTLERLRVIQGAKEVTLTSSTAASAASGSAAAGEGCHGTVFTASVVFAPLPAASVYPAAKAVADPSVGADPKASGRAK